MEPEFHEEFAHKLATDRNMTDIKTLSHDEIASILGILKDSESFTNVITSLPSKDQDAVLKRRVRKSESGQGQMTLTALK